MIRFLNIRPINWLLWRLPVRIYAQVIYRAAQVDARVWRIK